MLVCCPVQNQGNAEEVSLHTNRDYKYIQGVPKKMGFVIVIILAPKIIFKVTLILLGISVPYIKVYFKLLWRSLS